MSLTLTRVCTACGRELPATRAFFHVGRRYKGGLRPQCKTCRAQEAADRYLAEREHILEVNAAWRGAHPDYFADYDAAHADERRAARKAWAAAHPEELRARKAADYASHRSRYRLRNRAWKLAHPEALRALRAAARRNRRAREFAAPESHTQADVLAQYTRQKGRCYWCGQKVGDAYHVDHVIPLARGGSNGPDNLVIACAPCNLSKGASLPQDWALRLC